jgi:hypothetical protein
MMTGNSCQAYSGRVPLGHPISYLEYLPISLSCSLLFIVKSDKVYGYFEIGKKNITEKLGLCIIINLAGRTALIF